MRSMETMMIITKMRGIGEEAIIIITTVEAMSDQSTILEKDQDTEIPIDDVYLIKVTWQSFDKKRPEITENNLKKCYSAMIFYRSHFHITEL